VSSPSERIPPHNLVAERAVLGGILLENDAYDPVQAAVGERDFYKDAHSLIWQAMVELRRDGEPIDTVTLRNALQAAGKLERVGGDEYLLALTDTIPTIANIEAHARIVRSCAVQRALIHACHEIAAEGYAGVEDVAGFCDRAQRVIAAAAARRGHQLTARRLGAAMEAEYRALAERQARGETVQGYRTGFHDLDDALGGLVPKDLIILAARPAMGKTALANEMRIAVARINNKPVVSLELEMSEQQLTQRTMSTEAGVPLRRIRAAAVTHDELRALAVSCNEVDKLPIWFVEQRGAKLSEFKRAAAAVQREHGGLGLITVDYLQIAGAERERDVREQEVSQLSRDLKSMAGEFGCPVLALSQLNRGLESRQDKRPMLGDLRESGAIEQDADTVLFLYRDEVYNPNSNDKGIAEVIIAKQRSGPIGCVRLAWTKEMTRFANIERHHQQESFGL
jgi:replicative DNA helicase